MQRLVLGLCLALAGSSFGAEIKIDFGEFTVGQSPTNFHSALGGEGGPGQWNIVTEEAPSVFKALQPQNTPTPSVPQRIVLAQLSQDPTDERFPMFIYDGGTFKNFTVTTQFKIVSGIAEQMAGVVFRYQNESNFYVFRASALGHNVRFYKVVNGQRGNLIGPDVQITTNVWHTMAVQCEDQQIICWVDGQLAMPPLNDTTFSSGEIGFWTKSDAVTYFGETTINYTPIVPAAQTLVENTMRKYPRILGLSIYTPGPDGRIRVLASKNKSDIGKAGTDAEQNTYATGAIYYGHEKGKVDVVMPLTDRNGDPIAAVRIELRSYTVGETQDMTLERAHIIVNEMQDRVLSKEDLME